MFETLLNPIFNPLLELGNFWALMIISFIVALIMTLIYKWATDQVKMKDLKDKIKHHQNTKKEHRHDKDKMMKAQKDAMSLNMEYMKHSMKPTLFTFLPIIIIFGWLNAHLAYDPLMINTEFRTAMLFEPGTTGQVTLNIEPEGIIFLNNQTQIITEDKAVWILKGQKGEYILNYQFKDKKYDKNIIISNKQEYANPIKPIKNDVVKVIQTNNKPMKVMNLFGWQIGWLGSYIIFSIIFSSILRKVMKLH